MIKEKVKIDFKNKSGLIVSSNHILKMVREHFSVKNPVYMQSKFAARKYVITPSGAFQIGLWHDINCYLSSLSIPMDIQITPEFTKQFSPKLNINEIEKLNCFDYYDYQIDTIKEFLNNGRGIALLATSAGKCHGKGEQVIMFNGSIKNVENIVVGDELIGPDSQKRIVTSTTNGFGKLYEVKDKQFNSHNNFQIESYIVNEHHILSFKLSVFTGNKVTILGKTYKSGDVINISVKDFLNLSAYHKNVLKNWKPSHISWENEKINDENIKNKLDPYILGECLALYDQLNSNKSANFFKYKHIPLEYIQSSRENRLLLLAGIIDTNDCLCSNLHSLELTFKSEKLLDDVVFLCRSLGFIVHKHDMNQTHVDDNHTNLYFSVTIKGQLKYIPLITTNNIIDDGEVIYQQGITVNQIEDGEFFGFELTGNDNLYLLKDFTVTHNSSIFGGFCKTLIKNNPNIKILIIVPNVGLLNQLYKSFVNEFEVPQITRWGDGNIPDVNQNIIIANTQMLLSDVKKTLTMVQHYDVVMVDEVHTLGEKKNKINKIIQNIYTPYKFGMTGTIPDNLLSAWNIIGKIGPILIHESSHSIREKGTAAQVEVMVIQCGHSTKPDKPEPTDISPLAFYHKEIEFIQNNNERNILIQKLTNKLQGNTLILVDNIEYGETLLKYCSSLTDKQVFFIQGSVDTEERDKIKDLMELQDNIVCIAISKIFSTGISINNLKYVIFTAIGKSNVKIAQSIGRSMRKHINKNSAVIYDICDVLPYSLGHLKRRIALYRDEKIKYTFKKIKL